MTMRRSLKRAQELVRQSIPADVHLAGDLIEEKRTETLREAEGGVWDNAQELNRVLDETTNRGFTVIVL